MVTTPLFPYFADQSGGGLKRLVARLHARRAPLSRLAVLACRNDSRGPALGYCGVASTGVVSAIGACAFYGFICGDLGQQRGQDGCVANGVVGDFDGAYLQGLGVNAQVYLAPLVAVHGPVLFALAFAFTQKFDSCAVHQQVQRRGAGAVAQVNLQGLLAAAHGTVVWHGPIEPGQFQQTLHHAQAVPQGLVEQAFEAQAELDDRVREGMAAPAFTTRCVQPLHVCVQPYRQRPARLQRRVVPLPVRRAVVRPNLLFFRHPSSLPARRTGFVQQSHARPYMDQ